jgi:hypothetical protein
VCNHQASLGVIGAVNYVGDIPLPAIFVPRLAVIALDKAVRCYAHLPKRVLSEILNCNEFWVRQAKFNISWRTPNP